ncbi:MAG TPA: metallophosphoesterase family protein [Chloroflexota bacterium]|jgi:hypothetical protein
MTVWAFVADVHGNFRALERAEQMARARGAERFVALGDLLGRGQPAACVAWVRANATLAVVGNRDLDHIDLVDAADQAFLRGLPRLAVADDFLATHGDAKLDPNLASADERRGFRRAYAALAGACGSSATLTTPASGARPRSTRRPSGWKPPACSSTAVLPARGTS